MFDARAWLAEQIGCSRDELELVAAGSHGLDGSEQASYTRAGAEAGRVQVSGIHQRFGEPPFRAVMGSWSESGTASVRIGIDEVVLW